MQRRRGRSPTSRSRDALLGESTPSQRIDKILKLPGGDSLHYSVQGRCAAGDPCIFLLHGAIPIPRCATATCVSWYFCGLRQPESLPYKLIVLTRRGYGQSSDCPDRRTWSYEQFASELIAVADVELAHKFIVVGHSSGGPNALACAAHFPERVAACGLLASDAPYPSPAGEYSDPLSCIPADAWAETVPAALGCCCCPDGLFSDFGVERREYSFAIAQVECPTLLLVGQLDWATGTAPTRSLALRLRNSTLRVVCAEHLSVTYSSAILAPFLRDLVSLAKQPRRRGGGDHIKAKRKAPSPARMRVAE